MSDLSKSEIARLRGLARQRRDRRESGRFLVEGPKLVAEALRSPSTEVVGVVIDADRDLPDELHVAMAGVAQYEVARHQLERIASTPSPQAVIAEVVMPEPAPHALSDATAVLVGVDLNDPGNVGTLARSAEAAGFDALVLAGNCADPWSPKTVRAGAGALFRLPVIEAVDTDVALASLAEHDLERFGTRMADSDPCDQVDLTGRVAIVLGSEAHGLDAAAPGIDRWLSIPMSGPTESLNVAMAGTILAYESARQRRSPS